MDSLNRNSSFQFGKQVSRIRFISMVPRVLKELHGEPIKSRKEHCEFKLGLGPCGRVVSRLWYLVEPGFLTITQESFAVDGQVPEFKVFTYLTPDITGRIEAVSI